MPSQKGNVLFLILIAVALFAALAYAITQSTRSANDSPQGEKSTIAAAQNSQAGVAMEQAIVRMRISHGCTPEQINFSGHQGTSLMTDGTPYDYTNPNSPANGSCNVFSAAGGGAIPPIINTNGLLEPSQVLCPSCLQSRSWFVSAMKVQDIGTNVGASSTDLVLWLGRLTRSQCLQVNKNLGIPNPGGEPPTDTFDCADSPFTGTYANCTDPIGDTAPELRGQKEFCVHWGSNWGIEGYLHMFVLLAR